MLDQQELHECIIGNPAKIQAIVVGDSHADALTTSVATSFNLKAEGIISFATAACPFIPNMQFYKDKSPCPEINQ